MSNVREVELTLSKKEKKALEYIENSSNIGMAELISVCNLTKEDFIADFMSAPKEEITELLERCLSEKGISEEFIESCTLFKNEVKKDLLKKEKKNKMLKLIYGEMSKVRIPEFA